MYTQHTPSLREKMDEWKKNRVKESNTPNRVVGSGFTPNTKSQGPTEKSNITTLFSPPQSKRVLFENKENQATPRDKTRVPIEWTTPSKFSQIDQDLAMAEKKISNPNEIDMVPMELLKIYEKYRGDALLSALYWVIKAKYELQKGDYEECINIFDEANHYPVRPKEILDEGMKNFLKKLKDQEVLKKTRKSLRKSSAFKSMIQLTQEEIKEDEIQKQLTPSKRFTPKKLNIGGSPNRVRKMDSAVKIREDLFRVEPQMGSFLAPVMTPSKQMTTTPISTSLKFVEKSSILEDTMEMEERPAVARDLMEEMCQVESQVEYRSEYNDGEEESMMPITPIKDDDHLQVPNQVPAIVTTQLATDSMETIRDSQFFDWKNPGQGFGSTSVFLANEECVTPQKRSLRLKSDHTKDNILKDTKDVVCSLCHKANLGWMMIKCSAKHCTHVGYYHVKCVGMKSNPSVGKWVCDKCIM
jgi:hypothetical protein